MGWDCFHILHIYTVQTFISLDHGKYLWEDLNLRTINRFNSTRSVKLFSVTDRDFYAMGFIRLVKHREHDNFKRDYVEK